MFSGDRKCQRIMKLVSENLDSSLSPRAERRISVHLAQCEHCRETADYYREIKTIASDLDNSPAPSYLWERINIQLDEHPWGDEISERTVRTNWANYAFSLALILILALVPGAAIDDNSGSIGTTAYAREFDPGLENVSLYMASQSDHFPVEVRDYYLTQLQALDGRIRKVKNTLERYPSNRAVREQLTIVYGQKIKLYRELSRSIIDLEPQQSRRLMETDFDRGGFYE